MAKPVFDPSKPFKKLDESAPVFDPNKTFETVEDKASSSFDPKAALYGYASGIPIAGSYLPQIAGAASKLVPNPSESVNKKLLSEGFTIEEPSDDYLSNRDLMARELKKSQEESPYSFGAGKAGAIVSSIPAMGRLGGLVKPAASSLGRIGQAAGVGGLLSAAENPGDIEGQYSGPQIEERAKQAAIGAALSGAIGSAAEGIGKASKGAESAVSNSALKQLGANKSDFKFTNPERKKDIVELVKKENLFKGNPDGEDLLERIIPIKEKIGKKIGSIYESASKSEIKTDLKKLEQSLFDAATDPRIKGRLTPPGFDDRMLSEIEMIMKQGKDLEDPRVLNEIIGELDGKINYRKNWEDMPEIQQGLKSLRDAVRSHLNQTIDKIGKSLGNENLSKELKQLNREYGAARTAEVWSRDKSAREAANRALSLTDYISGAGAGGLGAIGGAASGGGALEGAVGGLLGAGAAALGNRALRRYGPGMLFKAGTSIPQTQSSPKLGAMSGLLKRGFY